MRCMTPIYYLTDEAHKSLEILLDSSFENASVIITILQHIAVAFFIDEFQRNFVENITIDGSQKRQINCSTLVSLMVRRCICALTICAQVGLDKTKTKTLGEPRDIYFVPILLCVGLENKGFFLENQ